MGGGVGDAMDEGAALNDEPGSREDEGLSSLSFSSGAKVTLLVHSALLK